MVEKASRLPSRSRLDGQKTEWIQWFHYRGEEGVHLFPGGGGGGSKETHITCDFPGGGGGSGPPNPSLDPHVGSPDATDCIQNHGLSKLK